MSERSFGKRVWYDFWWQVCRLVALAVLRIRVRNRQFVPAEGGGLVLSSHQSHLDPVLVGLACDRRLNFLARETLFGFAPFRWLIQSLDAIAIDREGSGLAGLKETLRRLKRGEMVLIFPEGTRTSDGNVAPLKPGFCALARRGRVPLLPVAIVGAFQAWPRWRNFPWPAAVQLEFGPPLWPADIEPLSDEQLIAEVQRRLDDCHGRAEQLRRRALGLPSQDQQTASNRASEGLLAAGPRLHADAG